MITRGLLSEQPGGVFSCVITIPADLVCDVITGKPVTISSSAGASIAVTFDAATMPEKPPAQQLCAGDLSSLILHEPEARQEVQAFTDLLEKWSTHPGFQERASAHLSPDPFQGPVVVANQYLKKMLNRMTLVQAKDELARLTEGLSL